MSKDPVTTLYTTSFRGIGQITVRELRFCFGNRLSNVRTDRVRDYDLVQFHWQGDPLALRQLGTVEDVFYWLVDIPLSGEREDLNTLGEIPRSDSGAQCPQAVQWVAQRAHKISRYRSGIYARLAIIPPQSDAESR